MKLNENFKLKGSTKIIFFKISEHNSQTNIFNFRISRQTKNGMKMPIENV